MLSSVALRAQISSIIDALSKAAVAEIVKVFEDGMVVMRLEVCRRDSEIKKLKTNIEVLHNELRTVQGTVTLHADTGRAGEICSYVAQTENCCNSDYHVVKDTFLFCFFVVRTDVASGFSPTFKDVGCHQVFFSSHYTNYTVYANCACTFNTFNYVRNV